MKLKGMMWIALLVGSLGWVACDDDDDDNNNQLAQQDKNFIDMAAMGNQAEIELGQIAATRSTTPGIQAYGQKMVADHQPVLDELEDIADDKNVTFRNELDAKHQTLKQQLNTLSGYSFDTAYINSQVRDHQLMITLYQTENTSGQDQQLKAHASKHIPHLQEHYVMADSIANTLGQ
jgi:putative membrane protein